MKISGPESHERIQQPLFRQGLACLSYSDWGRRLAGTLFVLILAAAVGVGLPGLSGDARADSEADPSGGGCGPYANRYAQVDVDAARASANANQAGSRPSASAAERGVRRPSGVKTSGRGNIVSLPADGGADAGTEAASAAGAATGNAPESEALLALPKDASGQISDEFQLGPGARIDGSFFSPILCSTVAKVAGPPGAALNELVVDVPEGATVVPNDVYYASAAADVRTLDPPAVSSNDPYGSLQYGLAVTGVRYARGLGDGGGVRVALLDSAPETGHDDLRGVRVQQVSESQERAFEVGVHGTLMAGVISANEDNSFGISGVAPGADLLSIPICRPDGGAGGRCSIYHMLRGLDLAWENEAQIINLSLSGPPNDLLERGVGRLDELGVVLVAAAGNEGVEEERHPAAYPTVIGVGAIDREGRLFSESNRGSWVELSAPGVEVLSTVPGNAFAFGSGTSLAAAHVSGVLAVLTGLTKDPVLARAELFRTLASRPRSLSAEPAAPPILPEACEIISRLGTTCPLPGD